MTSSWSLYIVIPFYRGHSYLSRLLRGLSDNLDIYTSIVFVDNSPIISESLLSYMPTDMSTSQIHHLRTEPNIGFGRACNAGALYAYEQGASHVILLNQDAVLTADTLKILKSAIDKKPESILAPLEVRPNSTQIHPQYAEWYLGGINEQLPGKTEELPTGLIIRDTLCGMCLVVPKVVVNQIGLFDPLFTMYGEDGDFCARAVRHHIEMYLVTQAHVEHEHSNLTQKGRDHARIVTWTRESRFLVSIRDSQTLLKTALTATARRVAERAYDLIKLRDMERLRFGFQSDRRIWEKRALLWRALQGESVRDRMMRIAKEDLAAAKISDITTSDDMRS